MADDAQPDRDDHACVDAGTFLSSRRAGDLVLALAEAGRLVLDAAVADRVITDLEETIAKVDQRLRLVDSWQQPLARCDRSRLELTQNLVDALFVEQIAPGQLRDALVELPKYLAAIRIARRAVA